MYVRTSMHVFMIAVLLAPFAATADDPPAVEEGCYATAFTQYELNMCAKAEADGVTSELEAVYQEILRRAEGHTQFVRRMREAQDAWVKYRDAFLVSRFPGIDRQSNPYGSIFPMCLNSEYEAITRRRIAELRLWIIGTLEGDVCSGSYPRSDPDK